MLSMISGRFACRSDHAEAAAILRRTSRSNRRRTLINISCRRARFFLCAQVTPCFHHHTPRTRRTDANAIRLSLLAHPAARLSSAATRARSDVQSLSLALWCPPPPLRSLSRLAGRTAASISCSSVPKACSLKRRRKCVIPERSRGNERMLKLFLTAKILHIRITFPAFAFRFIR